MVEVHLVRLEPPAAVRARDAPEIPQELDHPCLPDAHPLQLQFAVSAVVVDVIGSLTWSDSHDVV